MQQQLEQIYDVVVVGAGLSGAVLAERCATVCGFKCLVVDKRNHIGGNCYDYVDEATGIRVSRYGAHIFHTNDADVWTYVQQFADWMPYEHRVRARVSRDSRLTTLSPESQSQFETTVPLPVCRKTINELFSPQPPLCSESDVERWIDAHRQRDDKKAETREKGNEYQRTAGETEGEQRKQEEEEEETRNGEQEILQRMGPELYEALFKHYTKKQWGVYPDQLDCSVVQRIPLRFNDDDRYFSDTFQALPRDGYTDMFAKMLSNPLITVCTNVDWFDVCARVEPNVTHIFYTGPIDRYFSSCGLPPLEYRSIVFHHETLQQRTFQANAVVNYTGNDVPWTRIVEYKHFPNQPPTASEAQTIIVKETTTDNGDPYYPVPNARNHALYEQYQQRAVENERERCQSAVSRENDVKWRDKKQLTNSEKQPTIQDEHAVKKKRPTVQDERAKKQPTIHDERTKKQPTIQFVGRLATYKYLNMDQAIAQALRAFASFRGENSWK